MRLRLAAVVAVFTAGCAFASPIGTLGVGSSGVVVATLTSILFTPDSAGLPPGVCPGPTCWNGDVNTGTNLSFAGGPLIQQEGILINNGAPFGSAPPANAGLFNPFLQFALHDNLEFTLTGVDAGSPNTNCVGLLSSQSCSIDVNGTPSPVVLQRQGSGTIVSISFFGLATDGSGLSTWTGGFSATIPDTLPVDILEHFCGADLVCSAAEVALGTSLTVPSVSGSFNATVVPVVVPEPGTISLLLGGAGFMVIGLVRRKRMASGKR